MKIIKDLIEKFQHNLGQLDDCTYVECVEEIRDLHELNKFLEKKEFDVEETYKVLCIIEYVNSIIRENLDAKIEYLTELRERF